MAGTFGALRLVWQNEAVRRAQLALAGSTMGHWSYTVVFNVLVFERSGAAWVGIAQVLRLVPAAVAAPFLGSIVDRFEKRLVLLATDGIRAVLTAGILVLVIAGAPLAPILILSTLTALVATLFWPAQRAMLPSLVTEAEELTSANVVSTTVESTGSIIGPALAGIALGVSGIEVALVIPLVAYGLSAIAILRVRVPEEAAAPAAGEGGAEDAEEVADGVLAGLSAIVRNPDLRALVGLVSAQVIVAGALNVLTVVVAIQLLGRGDGGVGLLLGAIGVGGLVGALPALVLSQRMRLTATFAIGLVLWGAPLVLIGLAPSTPLAVAMLALVGVGNTLVDVSGISLLQRATPKQLLGRVFGALESVIIASAAIGGVLVPGLLRVASVRVTLAVVGAFLPITAALLWGRLRKLDAFVPDAGRIALVRGDPIFAPLSEAIIEQLATALVPVSVAAGTVLFRAGDEGDRYYLVERGLMRIEPVHDAPLDAGPGSGFGEIALIRRVPRMATLTAVEDTELLALRGDEFVAAVTGHAASAAVADAVIASRVTGLRSSLASV